MSVLLSWVLSVHDEFVVSIGSPEMCFVLN